MGVVERFARLTGLPPPKIVAGPRPKPKPATKPTTPVQRVVALRRESIKAGTPSTKKQVVEAIIGKPLPVKDKTLTAQQYFQETAETKRGISQQKSEFQTMVEEIKPYEQYKYRGAVVPGSLLKVSLKKTYTPQFEKAEVQSQLAWQQARDLPKDTKVIRTDEGYEFKFRDTSLDWSKSEFKKLERAPPGVRQVAEFGFGAVSSIGALIKPIVLDPFIGTPESRGKHFVSPLDVAFEPVGWSPKGSTELMAKHPIFTAGGIAGEVVQSYALTQAFKPISAGVKIGVKGFVKRVPVVYAKFTKFFPEEKLIKLSPTKYAKYLKKRGALTIEDIPRFDKGKAFGITGTKTIYLEKTLPRTKLGAFFKKIPTRSDVLKHELVHFTGFKKGIVYGEREVSNIAAGLRKFTLTGKPTIISGFKKKIVGVTFRPSLGGERVAGTVYRWGAKGYQKGLKLTSAGVKTSKKITKKLSSELLEVSQKTKFGKGAVKRVWLSPKEFAKAEKDIASKLALKKTVEKSYQARIRAGVGTAEELVEKTRFGLSPTGRRLTKKYTSIREIWKVGKEKGLYKKTRLSDDLYRGFKRYDVGVKLEKPIIKPVGKGIWYEDVKRLYTHGYGVAGVKQIETVPLESGGVFLGRLYERPTRFIKGFGKIGGPLPKKWIRTYRAPFLKNIEAQMSATVQKFKHKIPSPSFIGGKRGLKTSLTKVTVPSSLYKPLYKTGLELGLLGLVKTIPKVKRKYGLKPTTITDQFKQQIPTVKLARVSLLDTFTGQKVAQVQKTSFEPAFKTFQDITQVPLLEKTFDIDIPKPKISKPVISMVTPSVPIIPFLPKRLYGRGRRRYDYGLYGKERKFRKRKTFDPLKLDIKINLKGM